MVNPEAWLGVANQNCGSLIEREAQSIRHEYQSGHTTHCKLCSDVKANIDLTSTSVKAYVHKEECADCSSTRIVVRRVLKVDEDNEIRRSDYYIARCSNECGMNIPPETSPDTLEAVIDYRTEEIAELRQQIHEHHLSYEPESTIRLCRDCHMDIHHTEKYNSLEPDQKRIDWERD